MGIVGSSAISAGDLDEYAELLYLSRSEILHLYKRVREMGPEVDRDRQSRFDGALICQGFPELRWNPFSDRIFRVFSSQHDGKLSFEDMLDLYSALNEKCPDEVKAVWAFKIFDFNEDNQISQEDLAEMISRLVNSPKSRSSQNPIEMEELKEIADKILSDFDLDDTGVISANEFKHAVIRIPDFWNSFKLKV